MKLQMCRICLADNVAMLPIANTSLQEIYEKLTTMKLETNTSRPNLACYMCYARLRKCYHLRNSCLRSEQMLTIMLVSNNQATTSNPMALTKSNFLTITPMIKISTGDELHEAGQVRLAQDERIKMEATLTEEIEIKTEEVDSTDEYAATQLQNTDVMIKMDWGENSSTVDNSVTAKKALTTSSAETEFTETKNKIYKCNTNQLIVASAEDNILDKVDNTTRFQENIETPNDVIKQSNFSAADIKPNRRTNITNCNLETHSHTAIPDTTEEPNKCNICKKKFSRKALLVIHKRIHTGEKPYKCDICNKQFTQKCHLVTHSNTHTDEKSYKCDICNKLFRQKRILVLHLRIHTGEKLYKCNVCNKQFTQRCILLTHLSTHTNKKPYKCDICNKEFRQKGSLVTHSRSHTGEKPYKCYVCNKEYTRNHTLYEHYISIHKKIK